jgi:hypothetical protein
MIDTFFDHLYANESCIYVSMAVVKVLSTMAYVRFSQYHGVPISEWENGQPFEPLPKRKKADLSTFEDLILRLPHLGETIFDNLDNQSVTKCVKVNEMLQNFIHEQKSYWIRKIKCFFNPFFGGNFFF